MTRTMKLEKRMVLINLIIKKLNASGVLVQPKVLRAILRLISIEIYNADIHGNRRHYEHGGLHKQSTGSTSQGN